MEYIFFKFGLPAVTAFSLLFSWQSAVLPLKEPVVEPKTEQIQIIEVEKEPVSTPKLSTQRIIPRGDCSKYEALITSYDWPVEDAMYICKNESEGNPAAINWKDEHYGIKGNLLCVSSQGLMQIGCIHPIYLGYTMEDLLIPEKNIAMAYEIWKKSGWCPWSTYKGVECK